MDKKLSELGTLPVIDRATDLVYVVDTSSGSSHKMTVNGMLGISGSPVGTTDIQTLTNKTLTTPTVSSPVLSGTITGTYTIGGTPTFPSSVVTLTGSQTLTNKILTSPTINTAIISNPTLSVDSVSEYTADNGVTIDGLNIKDGKLNTNNSVVTPNVTNGAITDTKVASGFCVQMAYDVSSSDDTSVIAIPNDDTIPRSSEGEETLSVAYTPLSATNILVIKFKLMAGCTGKEITAALFKDSGVNAIAVGNNYCADANNPVPVTGEHIMVASSTTPATFKVRFGSSDGTSTVLNTKGGNTTTGSLMIMEFKA
jgi:hypothetical protein